MGNSAGVFFDQKKWVEEHKENLKDKSVNETFQYVVKYHPYSGCSLGWDTNSEEEMAKMKKMPIEEMIKYADAVTVARTEEVSKELDGTVETIFLNETSLGNMAYVCLYASDPNIREIAKIQIEKWKSI